MAKTKNSRKPSSAPKSRPHPPAPPSANRAPDDPGADLTTPRYTWPALAAKVGPATSEDQATFGVTDAPTALREMGHVIRSTRVLTDSLRLAGIAFDFVASASGPQREALKGYAPGELRVLVHEALTLRRLVDQAAPTASTSPTDDDARADASLDAARKARARLHAVLAKAIRRDPVHLAALASAYGTAGDASAVGRSLRALTSLARQWMRDAQSTIARRLTAGDIDAAHLASIETLAAAAERDAERVGGARVRGAVSPADLDVQDGRVLVLLEGLIDLFDAAHETDPTVPRLVPIATRRLFGGHHALPKAHAGGGDGAGTPAGPAATGSTDHA